MKKFDEFINEADDTFKNVTIKKVEDLKIFKSIPKDPKQRYNSTQSIL